MRNRTIVSFSGALIAALVGSVTVSCSAPDDSDTMETPISMMTSPPPNMPSMNGTGTGEPMQPPPMMTAPAAPAEPPAGFTAICTLCHGPDGKGLPDYGPELWHTAPEYGKFVTRTGRLDSPHPTWSGKSLMTGYGSGVITDADLDATFVWLMAQPKGATGAELYADFCGFCHGADGSGVAGNGPDIRMETHEFMTKIRMGGTGTDMTDRTTYMPSWTADQLTDAEIGLMVQFISGG